MKSARYQTTVSIGYGTIRIDQVNARLLVAGEQPDLNETLKTANAQLGELIAKDTPKSKGVVGYRFANRKYSTEILDSDPDSPVLVEGAYLKVMVEGEWLLDV